MQLKSKLIIIVSNQLYYNRKIKNKIYKQKKITDNLSFSPNQLEVINYKKNIIYYMFFKK